MARFDVYANPDAAERKQIPYFLDLQNDFLEGLHTRVAVPLWAADVFKMPARRLNPMLEVAGKKTVMDTAAISAVPVSELRRPVANLTAHQLEIQDALDALFGSY